MYTGNQASHWPDHHQEHPTKDQVKQEHHRLEEADRVVSRTLPGTVLSWNIVIDAAMDAICQLPILQELDEEPAKEELRKAINCLFTGKVSGEDGIPGEVSRQGKKN